MSEELDKKSILEMSMGAILERVDYEMEKVLQNILDPNTKATGKRKITVGLELIPSADRKTITVQTIAKSTLCPTEPITTSLFITTQPKTGEMVVAEMTPQIPGAVQPRRDNAGAAENSQASKREKQQNHGHRLIRKEKHHVERSSLLPRGPQGQQDLRVPRGRIFRP